jgi:hypothetical protein
MQLHDETCNRGSLNVVIEVKTITECVQEMLKLKINSCYWAHTENRFHFRRTERIPCPYISNFFLAKIYEASPRVLPCLCGITVLVSPHLKARQFRESNLDLSYFSRQVIFNVNKRRVSLFILQYRSG